MANAASKLCDKLLNLYTTQHNKLPEDLKKTTLDNWKNCFK